MAYKHRKIINLLSAYVDGALPPRQREAVKRHLAECSECRGLSGELQAAAGQVAALGEVEVPGGFHEALMARLAAEPSPTSGRWVGMRSFFGWLGNIGKWRVVGYGLAGVMVLFLTFGILEALGVGAGPYGSGLMGSPSAAQKGDMAIGAEPAMEGPVRGAMPPEFRGEYAERDGGNQGAPAAPPSPMPIRKEEAIAGDKMGMIGPGGPGGGGMTGGSGSFPYQVTERRLITNANQTLSVEDVERSYDQVIQLAGGWGGFVQNASVQSTEKGPTWANIVVRVPSERFAGFLGELGRLGESRDRSISTSDVTEEYVDLQARRTNYERQEKRLQELLAQTKSIDEVLRVEYELARVREQIEMMVGRLRYLESFAAMATVNVSLVRKGEEQGQPGPGPFNEVWKRTMDVFIRTTSRVALATVYLVGFIGGLIPMILILGLAWWGVKTVRRRGSGA
ncbi:MAG: DUF4349 domain-containing protein [Firmicutes bacterium]|nr:DUF4349 domain-containing protein [Bacillota bacterium]